MEKQTTNQNQESSKDVLRKILLSKMKQNPAYSARAFARDIGVSPAFVTMVLNGKKTINLSRAIEITQALKLGEREKQALLGATLSESGLDLQFKNKVDRTDVNDVSEEQFAVIADWYHFAIMDLVTTKGFKNDIAWIAKRLGLRQLEVEMAIQRLIKVGMLTKTAGKLKKAKEQVQFPTKVSMTSVREHHRQMMDRAKEQLEKTDQKAFESRMIASMTFAADTKRLAEARQKVLDFQQELANFLSAGDGCEEVFQLNIQLFPHTKGSL
jgi:uncharacterized protein (TIGR02147 family)